MHEIEQLRGELAAARVAFATKACEALDRRLKDVAACNHGGCPNCRDAEARAFLAKLRRIASADGDAPAAGPGVSFTRRRP
jgi:hypothetical protein